MPYVERFLYCKVYLYILNGYKYGERCARCFGIMKNQCNLQNENAYCKN